MRKSQVFNYLPSAEQSKQLDSLLAILAECHRLGIRVWNDRTSQEVAFDIYPLVSEKEL